MLVRIDGRFSDVCLNASNACYTFAEHPNANISLQWKGKKHVFVKADDQNHACKSFGMAGKGWWKTVILLPKVVSAHFGKLFEHFQKRVKSHFGLETPAEKANKLLSVDNLWWYRYLLYISSINWKSFYPGWLIISEILYKFALDINRLKADVWGMMVDKQKRKKSF